MFAKWRNNKQGSVSAIEIKAPVSGLVVPLSNVPDAAFASGSMGKGIAVEPESGELFAPVSGTVAHIIKTRHALILEHSSGLQLLLHIGIDTVSMKGEGFKSYIATGDQVKEGQLLMTFDPEKIKSSGFSVVTPILITNSEELAATLEYAKGTVKAGQDTVITAVIRK